MYLYIRQNYKSQMKHFILFYLNLCVFFLYLTEFLIGSSYNNDINVFVRFQLNDQSRSCTILNFKIQ